MELFSPAKINLFLKILRRREDGFHDIASLFQAVDLGDTLTFTRASEDLLTCSDPFLPSDEKNLVHKALTLFRKKTSLYFPLHIHIVKNIPMEAGLGGGSSNAATTLFALNKLAHFPVSLEELQKWGSELGSDVPFFFSSGCAYCAGRGEKVLPLPCSYPLKNFWLVKPPEGLPTPAIFKAFRLEEVEAEATNDLEKPALALLPSLRTLKEKLVAQGFNSIALTGSGTGILCVGRKAPQLPVNFKVFSLQSVQRKDKEWYERPSLA